MPKILSNSELYAPLLKEAFDPNITAERASFSR